MSKGDQENILGKHILRGEEGTYFQVVPPRTVKVKPNLRQTPLN